MFELTIESFNEDASGKFFNKYLKDNYTDFTGISYCDHSINISFSIEPTEPEKTAITDTYEALTEFDVLPIEAILQIYDFIKTQGIEFCHKYRLSIIREYQDDLMIVHNMTYIEEKTLTVFAFLGAGDWDSALNEMDVIITNSVVSQDDIDNKYTQSRHDSLVSDIQSFIDDNY